MDLASLFERPYVFSDIVHDSLDIDAMLSRESADKMRGATCLVFKANRQVVADFSGTTSDAAQLRKTVIERVIGLVTFLVCFNEELRTFDLFSIETAELKRRESSESIAAACSAEIENIILHGQGNAVIVPPDDIHFELPSGAHAALFLRVADAMIDMNSLDAICFWLLQSVSRARVVLVDNWSILPIALRAVAMLPGAAIIVNFFPGHVVHEGAGVSEIVRYALRNLKPGEKALFLLSVIGSGAFKGLLEKEFRDLGRPDAIEVTAICAFKDSPPGNESLCRLSLVGGIHQDARSCGHCKRESKAIPIDPNSYYPKKVDERGVVLNRNTHIPHFRPFFDRYGHHSSVLTVHRDDPNDGRHHAFYVDVLAMSRVPEFEERFGEQLGRYTNVDLIVVPDHAAGKRLAQLASTRFGAPILIARSFADISDEESKSKLCGARHILILDDQTISGSQLKKFIETLRENAKDFRGFDEVNFLVAVARGQSLAHWNGLETALTKGYQWKTTLKFVEQICLPDIRADRCQWCREYDLIKSYTSTQANPEKWITDRLLRLAERERGLIERPFLLLPQTREVVLGEESPFAKGGSSPICALFAFTAALQLLRTDPAAGKRLYRSFPTSNVFAAPKNLENLSEALWRAIALRAVFKDEWGSENRRTALNFLIEEAKRNGQEYWMGELFLAMVSGRMPRIIAKDFLGMFPRDNSEPVMTLIQHFMYRND